MRWLTAGESHGQALSAIVEGIPASVKVTTADIDYHLERRRLGVGRGARQNFEADKVTILGGVRLGLTQGGPIAIQVGNSEWPKWEKVMSADPVPEDEIKDLGRNAPLTRPRPGHADLVGMMLLILIKVIVRSIGHLIFGNIEKLSKVKHQLIKENWKVKIHLNQYQN